MTTLTAASPAMGGGGFLPGPAARPMGGAMPAALSGADVLRVIRQRLVMIILLWLFCCAATVGAYVLMLKKYPSYKADAFVEVISLKPVSTLDPLQQDAAQGKQVELLVETQAVLAKSADVLSRALADPELRQTSWYAEAQQNEADGAGSLVELLADFIIADPVKETNLLRISASWRNKDELPQIVNTVMQKYVDRINEMQRQGMDATLEAIDKEINSTTSLFNAKKKEVEDMQRVSEVLASGNQESERVLTLTAMYTELEVELLGRQTQWKALEEAKPEDLPITAELEAILANDPTIYQLQQTLNSAEQNLSLLGARFGANHRAVVDARVSRDAAVDRVLEERSVKTLRYKVEQIEQAKRNYYEALEQSLKLKDALQEAKAEQADKDAKYARYLALQEERDLIKVKLQGLNEQKQNLEALRKRDKTVQIEIRSRAIPPKRISSPLWFVWLPIGFMLGLAFSAGFALLLEMTDTSVRTSRDLAAHAIPFLGTIPTTDDDEVEIERVETACLDAPHSIVAEAFRGVRANLFFSAPAEQQSVLLITSPSGGDGKTTIASNLAISIALSGRRVLLIDANFRRPSLQRFFRDVRAEGLSNILIGQGSLGDHVVSTSLPGLDVLGSGPTPPNPAELLGGTYLRELLMDARTRYDQVIFDGPPLLLVSDAMVLAGAVDGVILVCQYRKTSRGALQRTEGQLRGIGGRIFGAVLNRVETRAGGYFRKVYREFYEYSEPEEHEGESIPRKRLGKGKGGPLPASAAIAAAIGDEEGMTADSESGFSDSSRESADDFSASPSSDGFGDAGGADADRGAEDSVSDVVDLSGEAGDSGLAELDDEIRKIRLDPDIAEGLGGEDEFKIDDGLDLGGGFPDDPEQAGGEEEDRPLR